MATLSGKNPDDTGTPGDILMDDDDETIITETATTTTDFLEAEMIELTLRYEIPFQKGQSSSDAFQHHVQFLILVTTAFDKASLRIYDNQNQRVKSFSEPKWLNKEYYEAHFHIHEETTQRKTVIIHRVMTKQSVANLKHDPRVHQHLKTTNTYVRGHFWKEDEVALADIGFLVSYIPTKHSKEFVMKDLYERCVKSTDVLWIHAPRFKLIQAQPKIKLVGKKQPLKTHAFLVQVLAPDASKMNAFLRKIYADEPLYIPYSMKKKFPDAVAKAILKHNQLLKNTWVIVLTGVHREIMPAIEKTILSLPGVNGISETNRTDKTGRWNVLVQEQAFKATRKSLSSNLKAWVNDIPDLQPENIPPGFSAPQVYQKNPYDHDDDSSSGQATYMSSCAQSYASYDTTTDDDYYIQTPVNNRSYAAALSGSRNIPPTMTEVHVPSRGARSVPATATPDTQEYHTVIAGLQADLTIANLQAEIKSLRAQLTDAQTPSTVTAYSGPETSTEASRISSIETNMALMTQQFTTWMTEVRQIIEPGSTIGTKHPQNSYTPSPAKRADTRPTPERNLPPPPSPLSMDTGNDFLAEITAAERPLTPPTPLPMTTSPTVSPPRGYHPLRPQYLYLDNGDGSLFECGIAGPNDFDSEGNVRGLRPSADHLLNFDQSRLPRPLTSETANGANEPDSSPIRGRPYTAPRIATNGDGTSPSLPVEEANPDV
jgi:hypothetical protein